MQSYFSQWLTSLKHYSLMSLFLSSPARLPYSPVTISYTLLAYIIVGEILLGEERGVLSIVVLIAIEVLILLLISFVMLKLSKKTERLLQTLSALIGVSLIVSLVSLLMMSALPESTNAGEINPLVVKINLILILWNLAVISLIFKRAFEIRTIVAGFIAFNYFIFYQFILLNFF